MNAPATLAQVRPAGGLQGRPQVGGVPQTARPQVEPDQTGEGLLGRAADGAPAAHRLAQGVGRGQPTARALGHDVVDPALDEGQQRLQPGQRRTLLLGVLRGEDARGQRLLQRRGVLRVDAAHGLLDAGAVHAHAARVGLHRALEAPAQPGHVGEQPLVRRLAQREVEPHVVERHPEALAELRDVARQQRRATVAGRDLPAGTTVAPSILLTHSDPASFPDPEAFRPERFLGDGGPRARRVGYLPFGAGPRVCIGNHFALAEAQLILATWAQRFRFRLVDGRAREPEPLVTLRPRGGVPVVVEAVAPR